MSGGGFDILVGDVIIWATYVGNFSFNSRPDPSRTETVKLVVLVGDVERVIFFNS